MLLESQYSNAMQRYGKKRTYAILKGLIYLLTLQLKTTCAWVYLAPARCAHEKIVVYLNLFLYLCIRFTSKYGIRPINR